MNSFEADLKRAIFSYPFLIGVLIQFLILVLTGQEELWHVSIPVVATFPYATAWLSDYENGYIKAYLPRSGIRSYIWGKLIACGVSGGLVEMIACKLYLMSRNTLMKLNSVMQSNSSDSLMDQNLFMNRNTDMNLKLIFLSAVLWAVLAATFAAWCKSRYVAYGGGFVLFYLLVILSERYFKECYCLNPYEWIEPQHEWIFGENGIMILLSLIICLLSLIYYGIVRREIGNA